MKRQRMKRYQKWRFFVIPFLILAASACKTLEVSRPIEPIPAKELKHLGYTIQVGAFSIVDNAIRLTRSLNKKGLKAYYFAHPSGLYKVRFGDFSSRKSAEKKAKSLIRAKTIDEYYIVAPEEYAVAKRKKYGKQYLRDEIVSTARRLIGTPYSWGGSSQKEGFDCSGLTMTVYKLNGLNLPHSSRQQYKIGTPVRKSNLKKGDLVFFATSRGRKVSHVGIYTGSNQFIHAPGRRKRVRIESLANSYFRKNYVGARTYLK
jgi:cell wall-associated NlpC family hydrolase